MEYRFNKIKLHIKDFFSSGHERTLKAKRNIITSFLVKIAQIIVNLLIIPITIDYVNPTQYGVWLTLTSIITWVAILDIGLSGGLRNKLVETEVFGQNENTRTFVSTTYAALLIISTTIFIVFYFINPFLNWHTILNITYNSDNHLNELVLLLFLLFCIQLVFQNINSILMANHDSAKASLISLIGQTLSLAIVYILTKTTHGELLNLTMALGIIPPLVLLISSIVLFKNSYRKYSPSFKLIKFKYAKELLSTGGKFFLINIGVIVLYQSDNIIISQLFGPKEVTTFNIVYKLFYVVILIFSIFITPFWSAFTDAYIKKDLEWIRTMNQRFYKLIISLAILTIAILVASPLLYRLWLGTTVKIPLSISIFMSIYVIVYMWHNLHVNILNGIGKIKLQLYLVIISSIANIFLSIYLSKIIGLSGIVASNAAIFLLMGIILSIQCKKVLNNSALNIWNT